MDKYINSYFEITSKHNLHIKNILHLRKKKNRINTDLFLIEGYREIKKALKQNFYFDALFVCLDLLQKEEKLLVDLCKKKNIKTFFVSKKIFIDLCYKENPGACLVVARAKYLTYSEFFSKTKAKIPLYLLVESVEKPGNLGALLRNCDAVGLDGMIICDPIIDVFNPNVIRSSLGTVFSVPLLFTDKEKIFSFLKESYFQIIVTTPFGSVSYLEINFTLPTVIVFGSEKDGVSTFWLKKGDILSQIPMKGDVDSLNIAMSATVFLYEAFRQRNKG